MMDDDRRLRKCMACVRKEEEEKEAEPLVREII